MFLLVNIIDLAFDVFERVTALGNTLYNFMFEGFKIKQDFIFFEIDLNINFWALLGGIGLTAMIVYKLVKG